jgi:hypothetical protein
VPLKPDGNATARLQKQTGGFAYVRAGRVRQISPTGKSLRIIRNESQAPFAKIFLFSPDPNQMHIQGVPCPQEGRFAIVTDVGCGMRWTRQRQVSNSKPDE